MKISQGLFEELKIAIEKVLAENPKARENYEKANLSEMRFRWDILLKSNFKISKFYNEGLNDNHIDTALSKIIG